MATNIKGSAISGLVYRFGERVLSQAVNVIVTIILARILLPEDYAVISLVSIFIAICNTFVTEGLGSALIQSQNSDQTEFSTMCWAGILMSIALYAILFISSPYIARYYEMPILIPVIRIMGLCIPIASFNSIQHAYVSKQLLFKKFFFSTLAGTFFSGILGITAAYLGLQVWALVIQYVSNIIINTLVLQLIVGWHPSLIFSFSRFKSLFSFAWKILLGGLITTAYDELRSLIIASKYRPIDLSFYTKGKQFPELLGSNISTTITNVMFPVLSLYQSDKHDMKRVVRRTMSVGSYLIFPLIISFAVIAKPFVAVILTEKWLPCVPYVYIFCLMYLFKPIKHINKSCIRAFGRSDLDLTLEIAEKVIGVILILASMQFGVFYLALSAVITYIISTLLGSIMAGRLLSYSMLEQTKDIMPSFLIAFLVGIGVYLLPLNDNLIGLIIKLCLSLLAYITITWLFKMDSFIYCKNTIITYIKK